MSHTVLITGGTGLIGSRLAERLLEQGHNVVLFDLFPTVPRIAHLQSSYGDDRLSLARGDISFVVDLIGQLQKHRVTAVFHLAAMLGAESERNPEAATRVNVVGTANVLEAARVVGIRRVLLASSVAVYGSDLEYPRDHLPIKEDAAKYIAAGIRVYGASKLYSEYLAQRYAELYGLEIAGLRLSTVYGYGRQGGSALFVSELVERAVRRQPVSVDLGDALVNMIYVDDVALQFSTLLEADLNSVAGCHFFNTGGDTCTVRQFAGVVAELLPGSFITVRKSAEDSLAGMAATVSDEMFVKTFGVRRRYSPLRLGLKAFIDTANSRLGTSADPTSSA